MTRFREQVGPSITSPGLHFKVPFLKKANDGLVVNGLLYKDGVSQEFVQETAEDEPCDDVGERKRPKALS